MDELPGGARRHRTDRRRPGLCDPGPGEVIDHGTCEGDPSAVASPGDAAGSFPGTIVLPAGDDGMMGDNWPGSEDSRFRGAVPRSGLIGFMFFRYRPLSRFSTL